jgi:hypothetical protein
MMPIRAIALLPVLLALAACGGHAVDGKYQCDGIPGSDILILGTDGTAVQEGMMLDHAMMGTGTYTQDGDKITVTITSLTSDGAKTAVPQDQAHTVFEVQSDGSLKWILATCKKL